jgi:hypothetical protein
MVAVLSVWVELLAKFFVRDYSKKDAAFIINTRQELGFLRFYFI